MAPGHAAPPLPLRAESASSISRRGSLAIKVRQPRAVAKPPARVALGGRRRLPAWGPQGAGCHRLPGARPSAQAEPPAARPKNGGSQPRPPAPRNRRLEEPAAAEAAPRGDGEQRGLPRRERPADPTHNAAYTKDATDFTKEATTARAAVVASAVQASHRL